MSQHSIAPALRERSAEAPAAVFLSDGADSCFHCGLPVPSGSRLGVMSGGTWQAVCCSGCESVASSILGQGLGDYYRLRSAEALGRRPESYALDFSVFDDPEAQKSFVHATPNGFEALLLLEGIRCSACVWLIERTLAAIPGVVAVEVSYATQRARLEWDPKKLRFSRLLQAVRTVGYRAHPYEPNRLELLQKEERRSALWRLFVAAFSMMQVTMYAIPAYLAEPGEMSADIGQLFRWASLALTVPVMFYAAAPFFRGALRDLRLARLGMDVPVALGLAIAFVGSCTATITASGEVYFDSISMFVFLLLLGRYLELLARSRAASTLRHLGALVPEVAQRLLDYPETLRTEQVPAASLHPGDLILVKPGEKIPADGIVQQGESQASEALLTGESAPIPKRAGSSLLGGSLNLINTLIVRIERIGADTVLSSIVRLVERSVMEKHRLVESSERAAGWFIAVVLLLALLAGTYWTAIDPDKALWVVVSLLVATCPCAFSLATPVALTVATGELARCGFIVTRSHVVEGLARTTDAVFDKTGTLTRGELRLTSLSVFGPLTREDCLRLAAALEAGSEHPIAKALAAAAADEDAGVPVATSIRNEPGGGIEAHVGGRRYRIGTARFVRAKAAKIAGEKACARAYLACDEGVLAAFEFGDELRPGAAAVVRDLRALGLRVHLLSGDAIGPTESAAEQAGIDRIVPEAPPADKHEYVRELQRRGAIVAVIGDGLNDAPVLAQADVSIAMGHGSRLNQISADAVLLSNRLDDLARAFRLARKTVAIVRENIVWAFAYNVVVLPLAFSGMLQPWAAAIGMSGSSLMVVGNALRLLGDGRRHDANAFVPVKNRALARSPTLGS